MPFPRKKKLDWAAAWMAITCAVFAAGCRSVQPRWEVYRFDDHLDEAAVVAVEGSSQVNEAEPLEWDFDEPVVTWRPVRGAMGFKPGQLVVKGEGAYPVITSPEEPAIDWARYESILIRMIAGGGRKLRIKFEDQEYEQELGPPLAFRVYRFDFNLAAPTFTGRLDILPTDSPSEPVAIDWIRLVPRRTRFPDPAGRQFFGKQAEFRSVLYAHSPSSITYEVPIPQNASLQFGLGIAEPGKPVRFVLRAGASGAVLHSKEIGDAAVWEDAAVDLAPYAGETLKLAFETDSEANGAVAFWANPLITTRAPKKRPNVLVYLIDTLRPDRTSLHGYELDTTPFLKKLGGEGIVFDDCHVQASWTKPSVASLLTSLYSMAHGLQQITDRIPLNAATLAETLRREGYVTASIVANPFAGRNSGLERGFDQLLEYPAIHQRREPSDDATDSAALNRVLFPWLEQHRDEPFFLYTHSTDPHAPYDPPDPYEARFADPAETPAFNRDYKKLQQTGRQYGGGVAFNRSRARSKGVDPDLWVKRALARYDAEIAHNDHSIEMLAAKLRELGILDDTLIVIVSDHGEEFLEHGWTNHGHALYQEQTLALWLMWNPKLLPAPLRIGTPVQLIDVMPTLLDLLEIETSGIIQGRSRAELVRGSPSAGALPILSSRLAQPRTQPEGGVPENRTDTVAWMDADWKLIYRDRPDAAGLPQQELYDRRADPVDARNVAGENPEVVARLTAAVVEWIEGQQELKKVLGSGGQSEMDAVTLERLRSLGYVQ